MAELATGWFDGRVAIGVFWLVVVAGLVESITYNEVSPSFVGEGSSGRSVIVTLFAGQHTLVETVILTVFAGVLGTLVKERIDSKEFGFIMNVIATWGCWFGWVASLVVGLFSVCLQVTRIGVMTSASGSSSGLHQRGASMVSEWFW